MWPVQQLGNLVFGLVVAATALVLRRWRLAVATILVTFIDLEWLVKDIVDRRRPGTSVPGAVLRGDVPVARQSFPSGHAVLIASLAVVVTPYLRGRWRLVPWLLVAGVCIGRMYVGAHNPLDVVAGCGLGMVIGGVVSIVVHLSPVVFHRPRRKAHDRVVPSVGPGPAAPVTAGERCSPEHQLAAPTTTAIPQSEFSRDAPTGRPLSPSPRRRWRDGTNSRGVDVRTSVRRLTATTPAVSPSVPAGVRCSRGVGGAGSSASRARSGTSTSRAGS